MTWSVKYQLSPGGSWLITGIIASSADEAWHRWVVYRSTGNIHDYFAVQVIRG